MRRVFEAILILAAFGLLAGCATTTPLMSAAKSGDINTVRNLLDKGADVNERGGYDSTALHEASEKGRTEIIKLLLDKGADVNSNDTFGETPLLYASLKGHTETVKLLLDRGANVHAKNYNGWTALAYASKVDIAKLIVDKGADVNARNNSGGTPLSSASMSRRDEVARFLIERGADIEIALSQCEETLAEWSAISYMKDRMHQPKGCIDFLKKIKNEKEDAKRREQEIAKAKAIEAQKAKEMKEIIKEVITEAAKTQRQEVKSSPIQSDIDRPAFSQADKIMGENDLAVIIGIEGYQGIPKSDFSYDDAKLVKEYAKALGFKERNIELITDEKATLSSITKTLEAWLKNKAKADSKVFVYYSGHGAPDPSTGEAYLVPYDGDPNYLNVTGYPLKRLYDNLGKLQVAEVVVLLDSCFSGAGGRSVLAKGARPLVMMTDITTIPSNMAVLSATQGSQISTSSTEKGHGVFTYYFLKALKDGKKTIAEIYEYIKPLVEDEAKTLNVQQSPSITPDAEKLKGRFELRK